MTVLRLIFSPLLFLLLLNARAPSFSLASEGEDIGSGKITINSSFDQKEITVGDLITYTLTITHAPEIGLLPLKAPKEFPGMELVDQGTSPQRNQNGNTVEEFWFRLRGDRVGIHTFSKPEIFYEDSSGEISDTGPLQISPPEISISIRSVLFRNGEPTDIRDIKPIVGAAWPWKQYIIPILSFITLAFLIGFLASRWVKNNRIKPKIPTVPPVGADELALRELERLYEMGYHQKGMIRELYFEFSEIFRRYLGTHFEIPALDWTTQEIGYALSRNIEMDPQEKEEALQILIQSDLVKFAKFEVEADEAILLMKKARTFILTTSKKKKSKNTEMELPQAVVVK